MIYRFTVNENDTEFQLRCYDYSTVLKFLAFIKSLDVDFERDVEVDSERDVPVDMDFFCEI